MDKNIETYLSDYNELPEVIRQYYSLEEYAWLSDAEKVNLVETECLPEAD